MLKWYAQRTNGRCPALARACAATAAGGSCWFPTAELYNVDGIGGVGAAMLKSTSDETTKKRRIEISIRANLASDHRSARSHY